MAEINKMAAGALNGCETVAEIDKAFELFKITELSSKIDHLIAAMGNPQVFMVPGDGKDESRYDTILSIFLTERKRQGERISAR
jgi:hypothetical protein